MQRKELVPYLPHDAQDVENAKRIIRLGYPLIAPVMRDLFDLMRVADSPAADFLADYFGSLGNAIAPDVARALAKENCFIRQRILQAIIPKWPPEDIVSPVKEMLCCVATQPDALNNDIHALMLIRKHHLADEQWTTAWAAFMRERLASRSKLLATVNLDVLASTDRPQELRLYHDLAEWYPLLTPVGDYVEEAAFYRRQFENYCQRPPRTLLDLGSGGGHNAAHLKATLACTLVDISPAMLAINRRLNPECEHFEGDMCSVRLGRVFDCVLVHDAVTYMTTRDDLAKAIATAFAHTAPGGVALFQPDFVTETFTPGTGSGGSDGGGRALRYLEWRWQPEDLSDGYVTDFAYLLRDEHGAVEVVHDRHRMGLFSRADWLGLMAAAGFKPLAIPFAPSGCDDFGGEVFLGLRASTEEAP